MADVNEENCVLVRAAGDGVEFLTTNLKSWTPEYPDAAIMTFDVARAQRDKHAQGAVIEDYGLDSEREVYGSISKAPDIFSVVATAIANPVGGVTVVATSDGTFAGDVIAVKSMSHDEFAKRMNAERVSDCDCGQIACICLEARAHKPECKYQRALACAVPIACDCDLKRDVCPVCDACDCKGGN